MCKMHGLNYRPSMIYWCILACTKYTSVRAYVPHRGGRVTQFASVNQIELTFHQP